MLAIAVYWSGKAPELIPEMAKQWSSVQPSGHLSVTVACMSAASSLLRSHEYAVLNDAILSP
jgi:hypothetical protein